jgi:hypothetical protein
VDSNFCFDHLGNYTRERITTVANSGGCSSKRVLTAHSRAGPLFVLGLAGLNSGNITSATCWSSAHILGKVTSF